MTPVPRPHWNHICGLIQGPQIVVAGSLEGTAGSAVDIYTVETDSWRAGVKLLVSRLRKSLHILPFYSQWSPKSDLGSSRRTPWKLLLPGGWSQGRRPRLRVAGRHLPVRPRLMIWTIMWINYFLNELNNNSYDVENDGWIKMEDELKTGRAGHVALLVPEYIFPQCEWKIKEPWIYVSWWEHCSWNIFNILVNPRWSLNDPSNPIDKFFKFNLPLEFHSVGGRKGWVDGLFVSPIHPVTWNSKIFVTIHLFQTLKLCWHFAADFDMG